MQRVAVRSSPPIEDALVATSDEDEKADFVVVVVGQCWRRIVTSRCVERWTYDAKREPGMMLTCRRNSLDRLRAPRPRNVSERMSELTPTSSLDERPMDVDPRHVERIPRSAKITFQHSASS